MPAHLPGGCRRHLLTSAAILIVAALPAMAQQAAAQEKTNPTLLDTIVVGAGAPKVAIDTPQAVSVIDQDALDREQAQTVGEIFRGVPGVTSAGGTARPVGQVFNIRGIGKPEDAASEARIIVTVDGAVKFFEQYRTGSFFGDPELYKRVEVLRGPASSTLYGSGAIGGVINFTTKDATDFIPESGTGALRSKLAYDSNGSGAAGTLTWAQKLGQDADVLASFTLGRSSAREDGAGNEIASTDFNRWSGLVKGNYHFGQDRDKTLTLSLSRTDTDIDKAAVAQTDASSVVFGSMTYYDVFGTSHLRAIDDTVTLRYRDRAVDNPWLDLDVQFSFSNTRTRRDDFSAAASCAPGRNQVLCDNQATYRSRALKVENTIEWGAGAWDNYLTFGTQLSRQDRAAVSSVGEMGYHPGGTDDKLGLYAQGEFIHDGRLTITPGLRIDRGWLAPNDAARATGGADSNATAVSPKIAALYRLDDNWGVFGSLARTERMPTLDELYSTDATRTASLNLEKERAFSKEIGLTWQGQGIVTADDALSAKLTWFHNDVKDMIATNPASPAGLPYYHNIGRAKIEGVEIEADYEADRWFAAIAYSKVDSEDRDTGLSIDSTPAETVALTLGAKFPDQGLRLSWRVRAAGGITNWTKASSGAVSRASTSGTGYAVHDLYASWSPQNLPVEGLTVNLGIENAFDRLYRDNLSLDNAPGRNIKLAVVKSFEW